MIPQYRGKFRSRRFESVISEATRLFGQGVREINLIGQDTTCYGEDLGLKDGLAHLLARLAQIETPQPKVGPLPLRLSQQGHAEAARHHRRARRAGEIHRHAAAARQRAGAEAHEARRFGRHFPEADRAHPPHHSRAWPSAPASSPAFPARPTPISKTLCQFVEAAQFDRLGVFSYSDEDTSASFAWTAKWTAAPSHNRKRRLMAIQRKIARARTARWWARKCRCWWKARRRIPICCGRRACRRRRRKSTASVLINDFEGAEPRPGQIRRLRITEAHDYDLVGTLLAPPNRSRRPRRAPNLIHIASPPGFVIPNQIPAR